MDGAFQSKVGLLFARPTKDSHLEPVHVELQEKTLIVKRHDMVYEDVMANYDILEEKRVTLERSEEGGLGISIQGGLDYKCSVKVYKVIENSPAGRSGQIKEGYVILNVNDTTMWGRTHDEAVELLKSAGKYVTLHLAEMNMKGIGEEQGMVAYTEERWLPLAEIPLTMALVTRFQKGTAILKPNSFQVRSRDGMSKVNLHCDGDTPDQLHDWTTAISKRIRELNRSEVEQHNALLEENEQEVVLMGWVHEQMPSAAHTKVWQRKVLVLRKLQLQIFPSALETVQEWHRPEKSYKLLEITIKILKPHELPEQRANSILLTSGTGNNHIFSFENQTNLALWTETMHTTTVGAVLHLEKQQFLGRWRETSVYFSLDINDGFVIYDHSNQRLWMKQFFWLKNSSDDGHSKLSLQFGIPNSQKIEEQEIELEDLQIAVCAMECFLAAKVAIRDPHYFSSQQRFE